MTETCPHCGGTGWKRVERSGLSGVIRCECAAVTRTRSIVESSNIPANFANATLENFHIPNDNPVARQGLGTVLMQARAFAREFPNTAPPGFLLIGAPGAGKTHLAVGIMKVLLTKGHGCVFFNYQDLLSSIRSGWDATAGIADRDAFRKAIEAEVLVLDDLGAHRVTDWVEDTITSIITHRCDHRKPLIATTNLPDDERIKEFVMPGGEKKAIRDRTLSEMIGMRARSRLFEMCRIIKMPDVEDYRQKRRF